MIYLISNASVILKLSLTFVNLDGINLLRVGKMDDN